MCNWTPDGLVGEMLAVVSRHAPPPVGLDPPPNRAGEGALAAPADYLEVIAQRA